MTKQEVNLKVLPADASNKELTVTLSDKNVATLKATANGVELDAKNGGAANLTVRSHYGEIERNIPVNVNKKTTLQVDGTQATASRYVKDMPENIIRAKDDFSSKEWVMDYQPTIIPNGFSEGVASIKQTLPLDANTMYKDLASQFLNRKAMGLSRLKPDTWYTITFYARTDISNSVLTTYLYPSVTDEATRYIKDGVESGFTPRDGACYWTLTSEWVKHRLSIKTKPVLDSSTDFEGTFLARLNIKGTSCEFANCDISEGKEVLKEPTPAPEDVGLVHGQPNLLNNSNKFIGAKWIAHYNSTVTVTENQTVATWGVTDASRIVTTGGTNAVKYYRNLDVTNSVVGRTTALSIYIQNNGDTNVIVKGNSIPSSGAVTTIAPAESRRVIFGGLGTPGYPQVQFSAENISDSLDFTVWNVKWINGAPEAMDEWTPSQSDFEGLPNLLDGTMGTWQDYNFSGWFTSSTSLNIDTDFAVGDTFTLTSEIDNTKNTVGLYTSVVTELNDGTLVYKGGNTIVAGTSGVSTVSVSIPSNAVKLTVRPIAKGDGTTQVTGRFRRIKLVKGDVSQLGIWLPKNRTEYDKNLGQVPFAQPEYDTLQSADGIVRAETTIVGRGAEIQFDFDVIGTLERKYPFLFEGLTTTAEKVEKYKTLSPSFTIPFTARGRGLLTSNGVESSRSVIHQKQAGGWIGVTTGTTTNQTSSFTTYGLEGWDQQNYQQVLSDGTYVFRVCSRNNDLPNTGGCISDGVTPAWVEVKDIRLEVSIQPPEDPNATPITIKVTPS